MAEKFKNKYRIESARLKNYDYAQDGFYFVTICAKNREMFFGNVENGKITLNDIGEIIAAEWMKTEKIRQNIRLDEWIIMPNHFHGIIIIEYQIPTPVPAAMVMPARVVTSPSVVVPTSVVVETPRRGVSTTGASNGASTANAPKMQGGHNPN